MNIEIIRRNLKKLLNTRCFFIYYGSRGQIEKFYGIINNIYPRIFTIKTIDNSIKSFSYSDYVIKNIKIKVQ